MTVTVIPRTILRHLSLYLPRFTDLFSVTVDVLSATVIAPDTVQIITNTIHGLSIGNAIIATAGLLENNIVAVEYREDDTIARFTTDDEHDFTKPTKADDPDTIEIAGFTSAVWNTTHTLIGVPNRKTFEIAVPDSEPIPTLNGNELVYEDRPVGLKGVWSVDTAPSPTTFTFKVNNVPPLPVNPIKDLAATSRIRMAAASDFARAQAAYTKESNISDAWLYLIMNDLDVSKDRHTLNDSVASFYAQDEARLMLMQNFSTIVFFPTTGSLSGATAQETAYGNLYEYLLKVLYGFRADNRKSQFLTVSTGHGAGAYNTAYYVHSYEWQLPYYIDFSFGFADYQDVAFRDLQYDIRLFDPDNPDPLELIVNLDEEPLTGGD